MPELPEVEITKQGIAPYITGSVVRKVVVRNPDLRWPVPARLSRSLSGQEIEEVTRRAKYLLLRTPNGSVIVHLGMSGSLRILRTEVPLDKHDHVDIVLDNGLCLRFRDPRRFGCILWSKIPMQHRLLKNLGPEPLGGEFHGDYLYQASRNRPGPVKSLLMNANIVSGVGNIYASEALYAAGVHPHRPARRIGLDRYRRLAEEVRIVLSRAIKAGGTTLRDFQRADGQPGYFRFSLRVYNREGEPCATCRRPIKRIVIQQRSTYYCPDCQH